MADTMQWLDTWNDAMTSLQLLQIDPSGFGGIVVRAPYGPVRAQWLQQLGTMGLSITKLPGHLDRERLLGGIDLSATLQPLFWFWHWRCTFKCRPRRRELQLRTHGCPMRIGICHAFDRLMASPKEMALGWALPTNLRMAR